MFIGYLFLVEKRSGLKQPALQCRSSVVCFTYKSLMTAPYSDTYSREIFERAINLKVSAKKMKFIFKRYLGFESSHGSPASVEAVKEKARAYVESRTQADVAAPTNN